ncbi:unnamed protein product [Linum tenue]|uniref:FAS1 domain-containing protein n=1 Tax=Linum tenue TaxID=586396 RepID=A0AAV0QDJ2_9ROSI|nr:unnamed protein product [Linum tenue]
MMNKQSTLFSAAAFLCLLLCLTKITTAQSPASSPAAAPPPAATPPAQLPASPSPTNVTKILEKAGHFNTFIHLLRSTQEDSHLLTLLNNSNNGATIFAPSDSAFSSLKSGTLNSLSDEAKSELVKFHVVPTFLSSAQFQTVSNPIATEAGSGGRVSFNLTAYPDSVSITTGLTNASIAGNVYADDQLAVYKVDKVLLPVDIFTAKPPAPAPAPTAEKPKKKKGSPAPEEEATPVVQVNTSAAADAGISAVWVTAAAFALGVALFAPAI